MNSVIWVFLILAFQAGEPAGNRAAGAKTKEACVVLLAQAREAFESNTDTQFAFTECQPVKVPKAPPPKPPQEETPSKAPQ